jgi:hypothetical protein
MARIPLPTWLKDHSPAALDLLVAVIRGEEPAPIAVRVAAAESLLDRVHGKAVAQVDAVISAHPPVLAALLALAVEAKEKTPTIGVCEDDQREAQGVSLLGPSPPAAER